MSAEPIECDIDEPTANERRDADRADLLRQLEAHRANGVPIPCIAGDTVPGDYWTSDHPDEQALAADACMACPLLFQCETYGMTWTRETGCYGGRAERERRPLGRPKKENQA
ncbi:MAG: WhiB family transcriptional regulator [Cellulomonadaceae bacterium]